MQLPVRMELHGKCMTSIFPYMEIVWLEFLVNPGGLYQYLNRQPSNPILKNLERRWFRQKNMFLADLVLIYWNFFKFRSTFHAFYTHYYLNAVKAKKAETLFCCFCSLTVPRSNLWFDDQAIATEVWYFQTKLGIFRSPRLEISNLRFCS